MTTKIFDVDSVSCTMIELTIGEIAEKMTAGTWRTDAAYQRSPKSNWTAPAYESAVVDSLVRGYSIGTITVNAAVDGNMWVIDGGHRSRFITRLMSGLAAHDTTVNMDSPAVLSFFKNCRISVLMYDNVDEETAGEIFARSNDGAGMSTVEQNRSYLLDILSNPDIHAAVVSLHSILPAVGKNAARRELSEEIILQGLSAAAANRDFSGKGLVSWYSGNKIAALKNAAALRGNVESFVSWVIAAKDNDGKLPAEVKRVLKKAVLNVLFVTLPDWADILKFFRCDGNDQLEWKKAAQSGSAAAAAVSARLDIVGKIAAQTYTATEKPEKPAAKKPAAEEKPAAAPEKTEEKPAEDSVFVVNCAREIGLGSFGKTDFSAIEKYILSIDGKNPNPHKKNDGWYITYLPKSGSVKTEKLQAILSAATK